MDHKRCWHELTKSAMDSKARENSYGFSSTESPITPRSHWTKISIGDQVSDQVMNRGYDKNTAINPMGISTAVRMEAAIATA